MNKFLLIATSAALVAGMGYYASGSGFGHKPVDKFALIQEENEEAIDGAIGSFYSMRLNEKTNTLDPLWVQNAINQANALRLNGRGSGLVWESMGPDNVGGRSRALLVHRDSANLMFVGSVSGGLFRSNTAGQSWYPVNDMQENLNVNCIAQTPDGIIYYGTGEGGIITNPMGERFGSPAFVGNGLYKSTDSRGVQFTHLAKTSSYWFSNAMVASPTQNKIWVASSAGLMTTSDGGASFQVAKTGVYKDMVIDKEGMIWATTGTGGLIKSDVTGANFTNVASYSATGGRTSIAVSPQDPNYVYLLAADGSSHFSGLFRSTDRGTTWTRVVAASTITDIFQSAQGQGYYDNCIAVDPNNKDKVVMAGVPLAVWDNVDGFREIGSQFSAPWNNGYVHADKHILQYNTNTTPPTLMVGCDGGLFFSQNMSTWTPRNRGYTSLQLYNVAANSLGYVTGGAQDNGCQLINFKGNSTNGKPSQTAVEVFGGDGFDVEFSAVKPNIVYSSTYYGVVARSSNGGQSSSTFWDARIKPDATTPNPPNTDFNTTYCLWEGRGNDSTSKLFLAKDAEVWVAYNPNDFSQVVNWFLLAQGLGGDRIIEMDYTPDGDHLFICKSGKLFRTDSIKSASYSLALYPTATQSRAIPKPITTKNITPAGLTARVITSVNVDQSNPNHVVITLGGYGNSEFVYESKNALAASPTWANITGDLPSMPVYDAVVDIDNPQRIILATDLGIWATTNGGTNWIEANTGMARVPVYEIRGYQFHSWEGTTLYLGTHGRGFFKSLTLANGTKTVKKQDKVKVTAYPNPAKDIINISFTAQKPGNATIEIYGVDGKKYLQLDKAANTGSNLATMKLEGLKSGYYFARLNCNGEVSTIKFVVNQ